MMTSRKAENRVTRAFIDEIEDEVARLVVGKQTMNVPVALLPEEVSEGMWIEMAVAKIAAPPEVSSVETLRDKLVQDDDGGDIKL